MQSIARTLRFNRSWTLGTASLALRHAEESHGQQSSTSHMTSTHPLLIRPHEPHPLRERAGPLPPPLNPTLSLLQRRHQEQSTPGARTDPFKLGLVVEGGGMRGVISGAMLMGLLTLGLRPCFDAVYGASAGAINATFFLSGAAINLVPLLSCHCLDTSIPLLSGQPHGLDIYTEDGRFIDLSGLLLPRSIRHPPCQPSHLSCHPTHL